MNHVPHAHAWMVPGRRKMSFELKRAVDVLTDPLSLALLLALVAGILRWARRARLAGSLAMVAALVAYAGSTVFVGDALLAPLESRFPPLSDSRLPPAAAYVAVLGTGYDPRGGVPVTAALAEDGLVRIVEGVRLMRRIGASHLIVSGGAPPGHVPSARGYAQLARDLGVADDALIVNDAPLDTRAEAHALVAKIGSSPFVLVTSAYHMPRAMRDMSLAGARAIPAPTGQLALRDVPCGWHCWLPTAGGLQRSQRALHEYLGFAALSLHLE